VDGCTAFVWCQVGIGGNPGGYLVARPSWCVPVEASRGPEPTHAGHGHKGAAAAAAAADKEFEVCVGDCVSRRLSPHFSLLLLAHTLSCAPVCCALQVRGKHTLDYGRAQESLVDTIGGVERGVLRDWNEMYQCYKDLPTETPQVRVRTRCRAPRALHASRIQLVTCPGCQAVSCHSILSQCVLLCPMSAPSSHPATHRTSTLCPLLAPAHARCFPRTE
jgi:hypothetical protein